MRMGESHQQLLLSLKTVVEGLLGSQVANVWNIYGGLSRLHCILEKIFKHECSVFKQNGEEDCWMFIQGLTWLQPNLATPPTPVCPTSPPPHPHTDNAMVWLYNSLETHSLSEKLSWLVSDEQHLASCYNPNAFLRHPQYTEATLICLRAIEQNQLSLLTEIHPSLYLSRRSLKAQEKAHRRCSSFPDGIRHSMWTQKVSNTTSSTELCTILPKTESTDFSLVTESSLISQNKRKNVNSSKLNHIKSAVYLCKEKPWKSLPSLISPDCVKAFNSRSQPSTAPLLRKCECKTVPSSPTKSRSIKPEEFTKTRVTKLSPSVLKIDYKEVPKGSPDVIKSNWRKSQRGRSSLQSQRSSGGSHPRQGSASTNSSGESVEMLNQGFKDRSLLLKRIPRPQESDKRRDEIKNGHAKKKSLMDDGGRSVEPMSTGFFPRPLEGQSLASFLSSSQFAQANAELDRENAHFSISEAIIATIEQLKCSKLEHVDDIAEESDEEIQELKQRIRLRRKQKQEEKKRLLWAMPLSDATTTDQSISPLSSPFSGSTDSLSTDGVEDMEVDKVTPSNLEDINKSGLSLSMASLYSEADVLRPSSLTNGTECISSAESVALSLLRKFSDKQLPRASEIQWLISEKEVPQQLLPMPNSWAVSADDAEDQDMVNATPLRGTTQWAPPRRQIIFTMHPRPQRKMLMLKQHLRCAGCGMKVAPEYAGRFRYCEYLGRYFCTGCHRNKQALIPARVLFKWDFTKYMVSDFSLSLLDHIWSDPLFSVADINPNLYRQVKALERTRRLRLQLFYIKDFLFTCRFAQEAKEGLEKEQDILVADPEMYSMQDLTRIRCGDLPQRLSSLLSHALSHVTNCQLCQARGFVCELCESREVIYPWELGKVSRCADCGSCYHSACFKSSCPRCLRLSARHQ